MDLYTPIDRTSRGGVGPAQTAHLDRLIGEEGSLLVFAEGTRSRDGRVGRLRSGAALLAAEHQLPIVPIYVSGTRLFLAESGARTERELETEPAHRRQPA